MDSTAPGPAEVLPPLAATPLEPEDLDNEGNPCLQVYLGKNITEYFINEPLAEDDVAILEFPVKNKGKSKGKIKVMKRQDDVLIPEENKQNLELVKQAIDDELGLWARYNIMTRTPWTGARNIVTSRFVFNRKSSTAHE